MSNLISPQKRAENHALADAALKKAQGFTKKTLLRWKPDWEQAGRFYRDAVKYYKMSGDDDGLIQACRESAVAHDELGQFLTAAQDLETAASVLVKEGSSSSSSPSDEARKRAYELYRESALAYRKHSNPDKSAQMLVKAAECVEPVDPRGLGLEALQDACLVYEEEQRGTLSDSTFKKAIGYAIKKAEGNDFTSAIELIQRQNEVYKQNLSTFENDMYKNFLCIVVLTIQSGDVRRAAELLETFSRQERFMGTDVYEAGNSLVQAMEEQDDEALATALKRSPFKYIMNQVAVIARKLKIGGAAKKPKSKPAASGGAGAGPTSQPEADEDADDFT